MAYRPGCTKAEVRNVLAQYFQDKADIRRQKAEQYPEDRQNIQTAGALERVAKFCQALTDDNSLLARMLAMPWRFNQEGFFSGPDLDRCCDAGAIFIGHKDGGPAVIFEACSVPSAMQRMATFWRPVMRSSAQRSAFWRASAVVICREVPAVRCEARRV
jgi:hypothetical protein